MKTLRFTFYVLLIGILVPFELLGQNKEVPITTSSKEALDLFVKGREKLENSESVAATELFDQAIQKDPNFASAYLYRSQSGGGFNVFRENLAKAMVLANKVSEGERDEILFYMAQADGDGFKEKEYLDRLLKNYPSDKRVQTQVGIYFFGNGDYTAALDHFKKATALDKNYATAYNMIGYCQAALNNYPEAEKAFQSYIKLNPNSGNPYDSYAELLLKMGKYDESIAQYKMAIEKDPVNFYISLAGVGHNYIFKGDYPAARSYYQQYYDQSSFPSGKFAALYWEAVSYLYEGKVSEAVKTLDESRALAEKEKLPSNTITIYANQGLILTETGNPQEGMKYYEKAIDLIEHAKFSKVDVDNFRTQSILWRFYNLTAQGDYTQAKLESEKAQQKIRTRKNHGEEMALNSLLGYSAFKQGNYDQAIQYYSTADADDPLNWYYQAMAYIKKGDKQNASKLMGKIAKSNVNSLNLALVRNRATANLAMEDLK
ncbi:MAG TPA: tetratricopeptide repeat protein [Prolixibacteraceae bacterium]|jgi:tetratricopeptide (TPR) repeat protein